MKTYSPETKINAKHVYSVLVRQLTEWIGSVQGIQTIDRLAIMTILNIPADALDDAILLLKDHATHVAIPSVTAIITHEENDPEISTHDVLRYITLAAGVPYTLYPSIIENRPVVVNPDTGEWSVAIHPIPGCGKVGDISVLLKDDYRRTDLMDLSEFYKLFI